MIGSLLPSRVNSMTYQIYACRFLAWHLALLGYGKDWLARCQDNGTGLDIESWYWQPDFPVEQRYKVTMSQVDTHPDMTLRFKTPITNKIQLNMKMTSNVGGRQNPI